MCLPALKKSVQTHYTKINKLTSWAACLTSQAQLFTHRLSGAVALRLLPPLHVILLLVTLPLLVTDGFQRFCAVDRLVRCSDTHSHDPTVPLFDTHSCSISIKSGSLVSFWFQLTHFPNAREVNNITMCTLSKRLPFTSQISFWTGPAWQVGLWARSKGVRCTHSSFFFISLENLPTLLMSLPWMLSVDYNVPPPLSWAYFNKVNNECHKTMTASMTKMAHHFATMLLCQRIAPALWYT